MPSLPDDLKCYRAPRGPWRRILAAAVVLAALTFVGPADFAAELEVEAEAKVLRPERAAMDEPKSEKEIQR